MSEVTFSNTFFTTTLPRASDSTLATDPFAIVDHFSLKQCIGCENAHFYEITNIPTKLHGIWAEAVHRLCENLADTLDKHRSLQASNYQLDLQLLRRIKMFFIFWFVILRKPPSARSPNHRRTIQLLCARLNSWIIGDWKTLFSYYEQDIILLQ